MTKQDIYGDFDMEVQTINFDRSGLYRAAFKQDHYYVQRHIHQCSEIIYVKKGSLMATVDNQTTLLQPGDIAVISPFQVHTFDTPDRVELWLCVFSNGLLEDIMPKNEIYKGRNQISFKPSKHLRDFLEHKLLNSNEEMISFDYFELRKIKTILTAIYEEYIIAVPTTIKDEQNIILSKLLLYLDKNHGEDITISSVAQVLGYSSRHISRILSTLKIYNFRNLLNSFRIEHAKRLIRKTNLKMIDISLEIGFSNERSFYRAFQALEGCTPKEYKRGLSPSKPF